MNGPRANPRDSWLLIHNPASGPARGLWPKISQALSRAGFRFEVKETTARGDARKFAREAAEQSRGIILAGGDGTLNEIVNGLMLASDQRESAPVLLIPIGTGNDAAALLSNGAPGGKNCSWEDVVRRASCSSESLCLDVGKVTASGDTGRTSVHYYANSFSIGMGAAGAKTFRWVRKLGLGSFGYQLTALITILRHPRPSICVSAEGKPVWEGPLNMLMVNCGRRYGGLYWVTPMADPCDGLLDGALFHGLGRGEICRLLPRFKRAAVLDHPKMNRFQAAKVTIESKDPLLADLDGELVSPDSPPRKYLIDVLPQRLRMMKI